MATTVKQDKDFLEAVISGLLLEDAIKWIAGNLEPEDVFSEVGLGRWVEEAYTRPDDLFDYDALEKWALDNDFIKKGDAGLA